MSIILSSLLLYSLIYLTAAYYKKRNEDRLNDELNAFYEKPKRPLHTAKRYEALLPQKPQEIAKPIRYIGTFDNLIEPSREEGNYCICKDRFYLFRNGRWIEMAGCV